MAISSIDQEIINEYPKLSTKESLINYNTVVSVDFTKPLDTEIKLVLEKYEGRGNQYESGKIDEGLVHQFYTPYVVTKKMWDLAKHYGFNGGNVCEPSCGTGRFFKYAPNNTKLYGFDLDELNTKITKALYPDAKIYKQEFETAFLQEPNYSKALKKSWLPEMDIVIGNPPYGDYEGYYKTYMPKNYGRFEFLFIRLGLQLLKKDGILIYIISQNLMNNGGKYDKMKKDILEIGTFVDAIRLPVGLFANTQIGTDIVIFRKK
jgi:type I restriction-modification system DNA methylase subunit